MAEEWALEIRDHCKKDGVAFFFKQWGGIRPKSGGRKLKGREWNEYPRIEQQREPTAAKRSGIHERLYRSRANQGQAFHPARLLQELAYKVLRGWDIAYVDGFSGPWKSKTEDFSDTSFMIAIGVLKDAQARRRGPVSGAR